MTGPVTVVLTRAQAHAVTNAIDAYLLGLDDNRTEPGARLSRGEAATYQTLRNAVACGCAQLRGERS